MVNLNSFSSPPRRDPNLDPVVPTSSPTCPPTNVIPQLTTPTSPNPDHHKRQERHTKNIVHLLFLTAMAVACTLCMMRNLEKLAINGMQEAL